jgi:hypothetical protein
MTNNPHDYQIVMKRTKTSVALIILEYALFPARFILFLFIRKHLLYMDRGKGHFNLHTRPPRLKTSLKA